jgi:GDSL-like Lipase/Acylhydrolase family
MKRTLHKWERILLTVCCAGVGICAAGLAVGTTVGAGAATQAITSLKAATVSPLLNPGDQYVSIGSSMASGEGIANIVNGPCSRSSNDYAQIVAATLQLNLDDVSCSAAVIPDVLNTSLDGNPPQIDAVGPNTKLITVGLGGNDIDYNSFAEYCGILAECTPPTNEPDLEAALPGLLNTMLADLKSAAPNATIVLVTYPQEFPQENCANMHMADAPFAILQQTGSVLENDLVAAAQSANVLLADPYAAGMGNHTGCAPTSAQWASGLSAPNGFPYHPTPLGHEVMAGEILTALGVTLPTPSSTVVLPSNGTTLSGSQNLDTVASSGVTNVQYELTGGTLNDQVIVAGTPTIYGWLAKWDSTTVPNGTYTLQSVATNNVANSVASPGISVIVNNPPPSSAVVLPSNGSTVPVNQYLDATASSGVTQVQYELSGGTLNDQVIATGTPWIYGWLAAWNSATVPNGTYSLQSVAFYAGGVSGTSPGISVTVNNAPPSTTVGIPLNGATESGAQYLDASASPGVTQVQYELTGGTLNGQVISTAIPTIWGWLGGWDSTTVPNGTYTLTSVASYPDGITGTSAGTTITVAN